MQQPWIDSAKYFSTWYGSILIVIIHFILVIAISYLMMKTAEYITGLSKKL
jgi:hypothetical protein